MNDGRGSAWTCPGCGRRVPLQRDQCGCGRPRPPYDPPIAGTGHHARLPRTVLIVALLAGAIVAVVVWERQVGVNVQMTGCCAWLSDVATQANQRRDEVTRAGEDAQRAGVVPGDRRDIRQQHRLNWRGWDR